MKGRVPDRCIALAAFVACCVCLAARAVQHLFWHPWWDGTKAGEGPLGKWARRYRP
jgi:hypothetical protein